MEPYTPLEFDLFIAACALILFSGGTIIMSDLYEGTHSHQVVYEEPAFTNSRSILR